MLHLAKTRYTKSAYLEDKQMTEKERESFLKLGKNLIEMGLEEFIKTGSPETAAQLEKMLETFIRRGIKA